MRWMPGLHQQLALVALPTSYRGGLARRGALVEQRAVQSDFDHT